MAIRGAEEVGTREILRDAAYHLAAVTSHPKTRHLADAIRSGIKELRTRRNAAEDDDEARIESLAVLTRNDSELDSSLTDLDLDLLKLVRKNRKDPVYAGAFPKGLTAVLARRGKAQELELTAVFEHLAEAAPELHKTYAKATLKLAAEAVGNETDWQTADKKAERSLSAERISRAGLVQHLRKNEGTLQSIFPGQKPRVRSFFRDTKKRRPEKSENPAGGTSGS